MPIVVTMSEVVTVTGTPSISMATGLGAATFTGVVGTATATQHVVCYFFVKPHLHVLIIHPFEMAL